jgi:hypothetical protein
MNVIQQEALAKAVGMSADELANSLITQENLAKLGGETKKQLEEKAELLRSQGKIDEANRLLASAGNEKQAQAALKEISTQDAFNQSIETLKSMLSSIIEGPAADFVKWFGDAEKGADRLKGLFNGIKTTVKVISSIIITRMVYGLGMAVASMVAQYRLSQKIKSSKDGEIAKEAALTALKVTGAEASTLGGATPFILAGLAAVMAGVTAYSMMNDGIQGPVAGGTPGYSRTMYGPEGAISFNDKDTIVAGTNLGGNKNKGNGNNSYNEMRELINEMKAMNNRPINIGIDGKKVIEATTGNQPNTTGDENRKNSYRIS